jgi:hypothetical protein
MLLVRKPSDAVEKLQPIFGFPVVGSNLKNYAQLLGV